MEQLKPMHLPLELVLNIITCSLPKPNVLLDPLHPITQLLLTFTLVCKETRSLANRYLRQHCVYLSSVERLRSYVQTIPTRPDLSSITSLYLAPFGTGQENFPGYQITSDDEPTAALVRELFSYTRTSLKRLIIDAPLRSMYYENELDEVSEALCDSFRHFENLEELVSVRDEYCVDPLTFPSELTTNDNIFLALNNALQLTFVLDPPPAWAKFRKLRRLALYNQQLDQDFWRHIATLEQLETLVLTRSDGERESNFKTEYFKYSSRPLKVLLVNCEQDQLRYGVARRQRWDIVDPNKKMTIMTYIIPSFMDDDAIGVCQDYVRIGAEYGTLWDWEGEEIPHPPRFNQDMPWRATLPKEVHAQE
jgi:hypothetical protein